MELKADNQLTARYRYALEDWAGAIEFALTADKHYEAVYGKLEKTAESLTFEFLGVRMPIRTRPIIIGETNIGLKISLCHPDDDQPVLASWNLINGDLFHEPFAGGEIKVLRAAKPNWNQEHPLSREAHQLVQLLASTAVSSTLFARY